MNKRDYLNNLLALCTDKQKNLFSRMYPNSNPDNKQLNWAVTQLENTLKGLNSSKEELNAEKKAHKETIEKYESKIKNLNERLNDAEKEINMLNSKIERIGSPLVNNSEDLALLSALQAAGVDNWDGYDYAIDILNGNA